MEIDKIYTPVSEELITVNIKKLVVGEPAQIGEESKEMISNIGVELREKTTGKVHYYMNTLHVGEDFEIFVKVTQQYIKQSDFNKIF